MGLIELLLIRLFLWVGLPAVLVVLLFGPRRIASRFAKLWAWLRNQLHEPTVVLDRVVRQHQAHVAQVEKLIAQADESRAELRTNRDQCVAAVAALEAEARDIARRGDDLEAKAALYKMNLERLAADGFAEQLARQDERATQARKRLHVLKLQLRQYEVGRSVLLSQLAEAKTVEQQYKLAQQFDPFRAVADWQREEGLIAEQSEQALATERRLGPGVELPMTRSSAGIDPHLLDQQLAALKVRAEADTIHSRRNGQHEGSD